MSMQCHAPINKFTLEDGDHITLGLTAIKKQRSHIRPYIAFFWCQVLTTDWNRDRLLVYSAVVFVQGRTNISLSTPRVCKNSQS